MPIEGSTHSPTFDPTNGVVAPKEIKKSQSSEDSSVTTAVLPETAKETSVTPQMQTKINAISPNNQTSKAIIEEAKSDKSEASQSGKADASTKMSLKEKVGSIIDTIFGKVGKTKDRAEPEKEGWNDKGQFVDEPSSSGAGRIQYHNFGTINCDKLSDKQIGDLFKKLQDKSSQQGESGCSMTLVKGNAKFEVFAGDNFIYLPTWHGDRAKGEDQQHLGLKTEFHRNDIKGDSINQVTSAFNKYTSTYEKLENRNRDMLNNLSAAVKKNSHGEVDKGALKAQLKAENKPIIFESGNGKYSIAWLSEGKVQTKTIEAKGGLFEAQTGNPNKPDHITPTALQKFIDFHQW